MIKKQFGTSEELHKQQESSSGSPGGPGKGGGPGGGEPSNPSYYYYTGGGGAGIPPGYGTEIPIGVAGGERGATANTTHGGRGGRSGGF